MSKDKTKVSTLSTSIEHDTGITYIDKLILSMTNSLEKRTLMAEKIMENSSESEEFYEKIHFSYIDKKRSNK
jgi:hypothetical protein